MLQALFSDIRGFLDKDFLFASLIPALVFLTSITATFVDVLGFDGILGWIDSLTPSQSTVLAGGSALGIIVFAYIVNSLRVIFLKVWAGAIKGPFTPLLSLCKHWNQTKYDEEAKSAYQIPQWRAITQQFDNDLRERYKAPTTDNSIPNIELETLEKTIRAAGVGSTMKADDTAVFIRNTILPAYNKFGWNDRLNDIYQTLASGFENKGLEEESNIIASRFYLDRQFGTKDTIRPTTLGNIVESYNVYPFKRYGMEGEVFWPHLQHYITEPFMKRIREQRIIFDFCLTMATLGVIYGLLVAAVGPLLLSHVWYWFLLV